ncbi:protein of unknown function [Candidatus Methylomirabilis oxygeniifera]|uniref:Uncharacterized protein n=1 Tax=Methylomirabilis oxygeniifera TaxID=671143 RepID=D5MJ46_METO1|nr:protein of unknown function [Candidatus Methylomirabilis oxyfera]
MPLLTAHLGPIAEQKLVESLLNGEMTLEPLTFFAGNAFDNKVGVC